MQHSYKATYAKRAFPLHPLAEKARSSVTSVTLLIFVEDHSINEHGITFAHVMHMDRNADFDSRSDHVFIEDLTALSHICDGLPETIGSWSASFPEHDRSAGCVRSDRTAAFSRGRRRGLRDLSPCKRRRDC